MIDCEVALPHHFFEVAITEGIAQIPAHTEKYDLGLIVTPLEEIGFGNRQTSEEDSGAGQSAIIDKRHLFLQHNRYSSFITRLAWGPTRASFPLWSLAFQGVLLL
jgi:hypothetical protein